MAYIVKTHLNHSDDVVTVVEQQQQQQQLLPPLPKPTLQIRWDTTGELSFVDVDQIEESVLESTRRKRKRQSPMRARVERERRVLNDIRSCSRETAFQLEQPQQEQEEKEKQELMMKNKTKKSSREVEIESSDHAKPHEERHLDDEEEEVYKEEKVLENDDDDDDDDDDDEYLGEEEIDDDDDDLLVLDEDKDDNTQDSEKRKKWAMQCTNADDKDHTMTTTPLVSIAEQSTIAKDRRATNMALPMAQPDQKRREMAEELESLGDDLLFPEIELEVPTHIGESTEGSIQHDGSNHVAPAPDWTTDSHIEESVASSLTATTKPTKLATPRCWATREKVWVAIGRNGKGRKIAFISNASPTHIDPKTGIRLVRIRWEQKQGGEEWEEIDERKIIGRVIMEERTRGKARGKTEMQAEAEEPTTPPACPVAKIPTKAKKKTGTKKQQAKACIVEAKKQQANGSVIGATKQQANGSSKNNKNLNNIQKEVQSTPVTPPQKSRGLNPYLQKVVKKHRERHQGKSRCQKVNEEGVAQATGHDQDNAAESAATTATRTTTKNRSPPPKRVTLETSSDKHDSANPLHETTTDLASTTATMTTHINRSLPRKERSRKRSAAKSVLADKSLPPQSDVDVPPKQTANANSTSLDHNSLPSPQVAAGAATQSQGGNQGSGDSAFRQADNEVEGEEDEEEEVASAEIDIEQVDAEVARFVAHQNCGEQESITDTTAPTTATSSNKNNNNSRASDREGYCSSTPNDTHVAASLTNAAADDLRRNVRKAAIASASSLRPIRRKRIIYIDVDDDE